MSPEDRSAIEESGTVSFVDTTELYRCAERLAHGLLDGTDDAWAGVAGAIADYERAHAIALTARVCALLDKVWRGGFAWTCAEVATGTYRSVMPGVRLEEDTPSENPMLDAIFHLGQYQAYRIRRGGDDVYAAVAWNIADNPAPAAVAVAARVCEVLDDCERESFAAIAADVAFGSPRPGQRMGDVTLEQAPELLRSPRTLGQMPDGQLIRVAVGRFGPFVQYGNRKYVSLNNEDNPYTVTLERALDLLHEKRQSEAREAIQAFDGSDVRVLNGRYGPYVTDGTKNGKIPNGRDPKTITLEECQAILAAGPEK